MGGKTHKLNDEYKSSEMVFELFPCGFAYNVTLASAQKGDVLQFYSGEKFRIDSVCKMDIRTRAADALSKMRYGVPMSRKLTEWRRDAVYLGHRKEAVSDEYCILMTHEKNQY